MRLPQDSISDAENQTAVLGESNDEILLIANLQVNVDGCVDTPLGVGTMFGGECNISF